MLAHFGLLATLHVVSESQPAFCHIQENQLGIRVIDGLSQLGAGQCIRSVRVTFHRDPKFMETQTLQT